MKYEKDIIDAYTRLGYKPRGRQLEDIDHILSAFLDEGFSTVVLSAPTGTGKSIIGAVVAEVLHTKKKPNSFHGASFLLTPTNVLSEQYFDTFQAGRKEDDLRFRTMKGANNFPCTAMSTSKQLATAEACALKIFRNSEDDADSKKIDQHCLDCAFQKQKASRDGARHLVTNYAYYFIDRMYMKKMPKRTVCVFDEAHLMNDVFTEHNAIYFSDSRLKKTHEEAQTLRTLNPGVLTKVSELRASLSSGKINDESYKSYLEDLAAVYHSMSNTAESESVSAIRDRKKYLKLSSLNKKYFGLGCKIGDLLKYDYPHAFETKKIGNDNEVSVKPIFVGDMFGMLVNAEYNLIMSATINERLVRRTMSVGQVKHIRLKPTFPKDNKRVVFYKPIKLSYNTLKNKEVLDKLKESCCDIVGFHSKRDERGIILAPSFALSEEMSAAVRKKFSQDDVRVFEHVRGEKLVEVLGEFKSFKGKPAVLLTPSGFEGLDLAGDLSRYQIILKAPYGSLGEARMKKILETWPDIYSLMCTMKLVQGAGRSVRSQEDYAITYMLDTNIQRLWMSEGMEWQDEFNASIIR